MEKYYIWWTAQGDCEMTIRESERYLKEGAQPFAGFIPDCIMSNLELRNGRHAEGCVWSHGWDIDFKQFVFDNSNWHQYIKRYCGGVIIAAEHLKQIHSNHGFVTDFNLNLIDRSIYEK